jgi:predicted nucleotidyltransferase
VVEGEAQKCYDKIMQQFVFSENEIRLLENLGLEALILFGSQSRGAANALSDYDIGVLVRDPSMLARRDIRNALYDALYDVCSSKIQRLVDIDIVFLAEAPMELQNHAATFGKVLYERTPSSFANFRERVMDMTADFAPIRRIFHSAILSRIAV